MDRAQVHFEVYVRKNPGAGWSLAMACEDRAVAIANAEELIAEGRVAAAKVTKETLDEETREFQTVSILTLGAADTGKVRKVRESAEPLCVTPQDLYTVHARERIGRLLEGWLERQRATPFELLHRPDLVEKLEATGVEMQHAVQKVAIPEAQARGISTHELIRTFQGLISRTIERLMKDHRKGILPDLGKEGFAACAERVARDPDRAYLLGAGVAGALADSKSWSEKVMRLLDLADQAPLAGPPRALALSTLEQPLAEILGSKGGLDDILGKDLDLGATLAAMTRLAATEAVEMLIRFEPAVAETMPQLSDAAQRLAHWLTTEDFEAVRGALGRRILRELNGPRRLRPDDPEGEIELLRSLAMALTAASGRLLPAEDVTAAFGARSRMLVNSDFVDVYVGPDRSAKEEVEALIWLVENVIGAANKRQAARYLSACVTALRFEKEFRGGSDSAAARLAILADLQRGVGRAGLAMEDSAPIQNRLGELGGLIEADAKLSAAIAKATAPVVQRLTLLLKLATGESAPLGPAADRARTEALKLVRQDDTRAELAQNPERLAQVREMLQQTGMAA